MLPWSPSSNNCVRYYEAYLPENRARLRRAESSSWPSSDRKTTALPDCCKSIYVTLDSPMGRSPHHVAQAIGSVWIHLDEICQKPDRFSVSQCKWVKRVLKPRGRQVCGFTFPFWDAHRRNTSKIFDDLFLALMVYDRNCLSPPRGKAVPIVTPSPPTPGGRGRPRTSPSQPDAT
jgi:hypothetical protein